MLEKLKENLKLIERKYLILTVVFLLVSLGVHSIINAPGDKRIESAKKSLLREEEALKSTQDQVNQAKVTGIGNIQDVTKSVLSYESLVGKDVDELLFDNMLSSLSKGTGVTISPPQRSEKYIINDKGMGYYNFSFNVTGTYEQLRQFFSQAQGSAGYLTTVGELTYNFQSVVTNQDGTTSIVSNPFEANISIAANIRAWVDLSNKLLATGVSSREEGLASNTGSTILGNR